MTVRLIGITNLRLLEQGQKFRARLLQFDHAHSLHLFRAGTIDRLFERGRDLFRDQERNEQTKDEGASLKSAEYEQAQRDQDKERFPDLDVADRSHEQVERRIRPFLVVEMKNRLVHEKSSKL